MIFLLILRAGLGRKGHPIRYEFQEMCGASLPGDFRGGTKKKGAGIMPTPRADLNSGHSVTVRADFKVKSSLVSDGILTCSP